MTTTIPHYIGGEQRTDSVRHQPVFNPATGTSDKVVGLATAAEVAAAVDIAANAQREWRRTSLTKRADIFFRLRQLIDSHKEDLAQIVTAEHGKVLGDSLGEISRGLENVEFAAGLGHLLKGEYSEQVSRGIDVHQVLQPVGVVACITPFNFPVMVPLWMTAAAIACGNAVILKPSERDPSAAVFLAELFTKAGLPPGVLNVVHGDVESVDALLEHPGVGAVSFVGSTPVAKSVYEKAAREGKRVQALGGAKNHMVVLPDADLDAAADAAVSAAYGSAGERCMAISVLVPVGDIADDLVARIRERLERMTIGPGTDQKSEMGPLITRETRDRVASYVEGASADGATVVVDGRERQFPSGGYFIGASLIDHVRPGMAVYDEEIFGPVLSVMRADSYDEAIKAINDNPYGNGAAIFTRDGRAAREFEFDIEAGMVGVNVPVPVPVGHYSFGGWKDSLFGDAHIYGPESIQFYTRSKIVTSRWPLPSESQINLGFPSNS
ncbi:CoA-acylating methylmalonate-semialdehyde dehydrogenase [Paenarthrobacter sp. NPDC089316]|uniref:CoA-acylating methylmalonate-semialdehyde dehydrogenase n=1 Tax=unclassified Paenarthrobacter TaxID=2634190 RepID=UPI0034498CDA